MKTIILCGGRGTRLGAHGATVPKALIEIGGRPIIWHLLRLYGHYGFNDFVLCLGHLSASIKRYFLEQQWLDQDFTLTADGAGPRLPQPSASANDWRVTFAETGLDTNTGERIRRVRHYLGDDEDFFVTYGDGLADIDVAAVLKFHRAHGRIATLTTVHPQLNFGLLKLDDTGAVTEFHEKPSMPEWINGGFFVFNRRIFDYLPPDSILEREPLECLAQERQLIAYQHNGFWKCMDTYKDNLEFNQLWDAGQAAWKVW